MNGVLFLMDSTVQMKDMNHENLNKFFGLCIDVANIFVVTEHCDRGSLSVCTDSFLLAFFGHMCNFDHKLI